MKRTEVIKIFKNEGLVSEVKSVFPRKLEIRACFRGIEGRIQVKKKEPVQSIITKILLLNKDLMKLAGFDKLSLSKC